MAFKDREEQREWQRGWYKRNKERVLERGRVQKQEYFAYIHKAKDVPCASCGERFHPDVMDFHHVVPSEKNRAISKFRSVGPALKREIEKCVVMCANCHRMKHVEMKGE